jgi:hypothetical protein
LPGPFRPRQDRPTLDAIEAAINPIDAPRNAGVLRFEKAEALLDLDHGSLQIGNIAPDGTEMLEDQIGAFV